jgi:dipeptidyl aminopeptidase/acylaminoacyl peptidase
VSNTFLPLSGTSGAERKRREQQPAIAEIDLTSDAVTPIVWERGRTSFEEELPSMIVGVEFQPEHDRLLVTEKPKGGEKLIRKTYRKHGSQSWRQERQEEGTSSSSQTLSVELRQSLNARPRLYVKRRQDEPAVELFDPNPQADQLTFSTTEVVHWTDSNGIEWQGGLLRPRGYVKGRRYPLVVQTHGFDPGKFLLDGPAYDGEGMTAMAAQALASAGFAVLQIEDNRKAVTGDEQEGPRVAAGWYAGIEKLIADGVVDQNNIGLIAFSRTGFHALYLMAAHPDLLGAVSLSDALQAGYASYLMVDNELFAAEIAKLTGGKPNVSNIGDWFARNPLYKLGHVRAPVRLEEMGAGVGFWETFTVLRDAGRPVEFVVYPNGSHVLQKPDERLASQGGSVDWFSFWLRGYEDPNPDKRAQYTRWRKLRELRSTH